MVDAEIVQITRDGREKRDPAWSPDGTMIAYSVRDRATHVRTISIVSEEIASLGRYDFFADGNDSPFTLSPDKNRIAYRAGNDLEIFDLSTQTKTRVQFTTLHLVATPVWSPDGERLAFPGSRSSSSADIWVFSIRDSSLQQVTDFEGIESAPTWAPDGTRLAYQHNGADTLFEIWLADLQSGESSVLVSDSLTHFLFPSWSPNGRQLAFMADSLRPGPSSIRVLELESLEEKTLMEFVFGNNLVWSPDGSKLAFNSTLSRTAIISADGDILHTLTVDDSPVWYDDDHLIFADKVNFRFIEVLSLEDSTTFAVTKIEDFWFVGQPAWFPDNRRLVFSDENSWPSGERRLWITNLNSGKLEPLFSDVSFFQYSQNPAISPDGQWLIYEQFDRLYLASTQDFKPIHITQKLSRGADYRNPAWSPESNAIVCEFFDFERSEFGLRVFEVDSSLEVREHEILGRFFGPTWSNAKSNGSSRIAALKTDGRAGIYIIPPDASYSELAVRPGAMPTWAPDGERLAYIWHDEIYVARVFLPLNDEQQ